MTAVDPNQSPGPDFSTGGRVATSWSTFPSRPRTRQAGDLFRPVTSAEPPTAAFTDQPLPPVNGLTEDREQVPAPAPPSGLVPPARRWTSRAAGLVAGTSGMVMAFVASAVLVLVVAGMTMLRSPSSTESPVAEASPGRFPAPATPAISGGHPVSAAPVDAPTEVARPAPATSYSPAPPAVPAARQQLPTPRHDLPATQVTRPAPNHEPVLPPPSPQTPSFPPPSTVTTEDAGYWTITNTSHTKNMEPSSAGAGPCRCDATMRQDPDDSRYRPSRDDRQRESRMQQERYRRTSTMQESKINEEQQQDQQVTETGQHGRPPTTARPRP
jgi:hypothetical protein